MRKTLIVNILLLLALLLAACAPAAPAAVELTQSPVVDVQPSAASPSEEQSGAPAAEPTAAAAQDQPAAAVPVSAGAQVYKIVPGESQVSYEVGETFINDNNRFNLAVGVTPVVNGEITVDTANPSASQIGPITVDISQFKSDSTRRDNFIRDRFLESRRFPTATFTPTSLSGLPETYSDGQELAFQVTGDLTVHEITRSVTFDVTARLGDGALTGSATTTILMSEFQVGPINLAGILKTEDQAKLIFNFVARP